MPDRGAQVRVGRRERRGEGHDAARRFGAEISVSPAWWPGAVRPFPAADFLMLYSPLSVRAELVEEPSFFFRSKTRTALRQDRKDAVSGGSMAERVSLGGWRIFKKK